MQDARSTHCYLNGFIGRYVCVCVRVWGIRDSSPFCSGRVGLHQPSVAVAWSGHVALIWDSSVSASLSKARKSPRVPPVSHPESVTGALSISLFTESLTWDMFYQKAYSLFLFNLFQSRMYGPKRINKITQAVFGLNSWSIVIRYFQNCLHVAFMCVFFINIYCVFLHIWFECVCFSWALNPFLGALVRYWDPTASKLGEGSSVVHAKRKKHKGKETQHFVIAFSNMWYCRVWK